QVVDVAAAPGAGLVSRRILKGGRTEDFAPALAPAQPVSVVECVSCLVAQNAHEPACIAAFDLAHDAALEALEARMRKVERYRDAGDAVRREPLFRQPHVRLEVESSGLELRVEAPHTALET